MTLKMRQTEVTDWANIVPQEAEVPVGYDEQ